MTTVAVMQPYFMPYAGYFRLFCAADVFVVFDCVQFPRRGWVHRNRFALSDGREDWLTLPIRKCARDTRIDELRFADDTTALSRAVQRFPVLKAAGDDAVPLMTRITDIGTGTVADYLCAQLAHVTESLGMARPMVRSSTLGVAADLHGQSRVIAIAAALGARRYVNSPGGRELYDPAAFAAHGIELCFLTPFCGPADSILTSLLTRPAGRVAASIRYETHLC